MKDWMLSMFFAAMGGSLASLFWPLLIALWRRQSNEITRAFGLDGAIGAYASAQDNPGSALFRFFYRVFEIVLLPFVRYTGKMIVFLVVAFLIALVSTAIGFATFLQNDETRTALQSTGLLAYFSAFNYGFTAASVVSEPLKSRANATNTSAN